MSYGQPCDNITAGPALGPASAYPTFRSPASTCFSEPNEVFVPGLTAGRSAGGVLLAWALAAPNRPSRAAAIVKKAEPANRRRRWLISADISGAPWWTGRHSLERHDALG